MIENDFIFIMKNILFNINKNKIFANLLNIYFFTLGFLAEKNKHDCNTYY